MKPWPCGFSLIELMVALAVLGILVAIGLPSYSTWIQNQQIRTAAEAGVNGLQLARAEAVRRNANVQIEFDVAGGWSVSLVGAGTLIQTRPAGETASSVTVAFTPTDATTVTFNALGRVIANDDASPILTQIAFDSNVLAGADSRDLRVTVGPGGMVRMCDPALASDDPRAC